MVVPGLLARRHLRPRAACSRCSAGRACTGSLWFTLWSATVGTLVSLALGLPAAHVLYRRRLPGGQVLRAALLAPFVLPTVVVGVAFRQLLGESGPLGFLGLDGIGGRDHRRAGVLQRLGRDPRRRAAPGSRSTRDRPRPPRPSARRPAQVLRTVTLPALRPAIVSAASVVFLFCATAFGVVLTLGGLRYSSVETEIYLLTTKLLDLQAAAALSVLQLRGGHRPAARGARAPVVRRTRRSPGSWPGRGDSREATRRPWSRRRCWRCSWPRPILALVVGLAAHGDVWSLANYRALGTTGEQQALVVPVTEALATSLRTAVDATWMSLLLGLTVAVIATRRSRSTAERRVRALLDGVFMLPLGVSAVTLGFGFLITLDEPPLDLRDSPLLVPIAQALVALPLVVRTLAPVLAGVDDRLRAGRRDARRLARGGRR